MPNLVGTGLNQVPTNSMLGGLAYQDPEHASIKNLDLKNLSQINSEIADTAVDVFVYDTSKDSDGGAWRKRTQNTSWYNETLGTSTRGSRKEFPAVAVIVAESDKVTIYDGDDPDLPMWMVIDRASSAGWTPNTTNILGVSYSEVTSCAAKNGLLVVSMPYYSDVNNGTVIKISFLEDAGYHHFTQAVSINYPAGRYGKFRGNIAERNTGKGHININDTAGLVQANANDLAITVLPNAPVDSATGLPIPTIAVATDGGVSVIKDDGTIVDITSGVIIHHEPRGVDFFGSRLFWTEGNNYDLQDRAFLNAPIPPSDIQLTHNGALPSGYIGYGLGGGANNIFNNYAFLLPLNNEPATRQRKFQIAGPDNNIFLGCKHAVNGGIEHIHQNIKSPSNGMVVTTTSSYNTGWMHGDCKGAFLSDTDIEDGVELVSNGTFDASSSGWTMNGGGNIAISSGQAQLTNNGTTNCSLDQTVTTVVGKTYEISANITPQGGGPMPRMYVGNKYVQVGSNSNSSQTVTLTFLAYSTSTIVSINANTNVNNAVTLADNVSMKLTNDVIGSEKIPNPGNGNFTATTDWVAQTAGGSLSISGANLRVNCSGNYHGCQVNTSNLPTLVEGKQYIMTVDVAAVSAGSIRFGVVSGMTYSGSIGGNGVHHTVFTAGASVTQIFIDTGTYGSSMYFELNSVNLREAELDRSVNGGVGNNNKGLAVYGTITKTPVATGADLVAYSGFSNSNYIKQPPNSDMQTGTGDFSVSCWFKTTSNENAYEGLIYYNSPGVINKGFQLMLGPTNSNKGIYWYVYGASSAVDSGYITGLNNGQWNCVVATYTSSQIKVYVNGVLRTTGNHTVGSINNSDAQFTVGRWYGNTTSQYQWRGSIALVRHSKSIPSPEQIKKIYNDEKVLFQENAKCTLHGSSDAVTALAFDDTSNLLHVGTSAGRSEFQGLRRINNTTTAVTTAISAHDEFIIEQ